MSKAQVKVVNGGLLAALNHGSNSVYMCPSCHCTLEREDVELHAIFGPEAEEGRFNLRQGIEEGIQKELVLIAKRRGIPVEDLILEAKQRLIEEDTLAPKGAELDTKLCQPRGEEGRMPGDPGV